LQCDASDDVAEKILHRKTKHDGSDSGRDEKALDGLIITNIEDKKNGYENDDCVDDFSQEFRYCNAMLFLEVEFENIAIDERYEKCRAENDNGRAEVVEESPGQIEVERGSIYGKANSQQVIEHAEPNAMFALKPAPAQNQQAINPGDAQREEKVFVTLGQLRHLADANSLPLIGQLSRFFWQEASKIALSSIL